MRIGIVGDIHAPFTHPEYKRFIKDTFKAWKVDHVHFIGDVVDMHAVSFHDSDPNGLSPEDEAEEAMEEVAEWYATYPKATVSIGNHDERHFRMAKKAGIPDRFIAAYSEVWKTPKWDWQTSHMFDDVLYEHGTGSNGKDAAYNRAIGKRMSVVMGHVHAFGGVKFHANETSRIFGMNVGCGVDCRAYAMEYGKNFVNRPVLGCGIVIDGKEAYFEPMQCGEGEEYERWN